MTRRSRAISLAFVLLNGFCVGYMAHSGRWMFVAVNGAVALWLAWQVVTYPQADR
jgi:uncharacterized membrane protein